MFIVAKRWMDQDATWHEGRPQPRRFCVRWEPSFPSPQKGWSPLRNFRPISIVAKRLDASRCHLVRRYTSAQGTLCYMRTQPPSQKGGGAWGRSAWGRSPPILGPCLLWPNGWMDQDGTLHGGRPWSSPHCARWGHISSPQKRMQSHQFFAHLYCGQTAGYIKMPLGMEVGLRPGDFVINGNPVPYPKRGAAPPNFRPTSTVAKRLHRSRCHLLRG